jgi:ABC-type nitrate/sulfonate/bicarbonate transport system ATPase subunit
MVSLSLMDVSRSFSVDGRNLLAVDGVDLELGEGEIVTIVGPSGSGKTTLLRIAAGLESIDGGQVVRGSGMRTGFVFQEPRLLSSLTVEGNISLGLGSGKAERAMGARVAEILEVLGLSGFRRAYPNQLSGGLAQRVALGRALVRDPDLLFMDEPFSALDTPLRRRLQDELLGILASRSMSLVFVTHDLVEALYLGDRVVALRRGRIVRDERIELVRPRDPRSADFIELMDSLTATLGEVARDPEAAGEVHLEEESA